MKYYFLNKKTVEIKKILELARIETGAESNDIDDDILLQILNENIFEILALIQHKKSDEFFAVSILNDLVTEQYRYGELEYLHENGKTLKIRKILNVRINGQNIKRVDVLSVDENFLKNISSPVYGVSGQDLYVFHKEKEIIFDGIEVIGLTEVPEIKLNTKFEDIFLGKIKIDKRILKLSLKPFLYERMGNFSMAQNSRIFYEKEMKNFINKLGKIKEPIDREIPDLSLYS